ncbi:hypothetical protein DFP72DRAFT_1151862 [Ephemerocybe angulata]|uniref:Uncharacterized protein n=1 Tax=Ephemerocybe angulata TaxID=980116 RepID=A0A8H6IAA5_9AGAR|nr:hypothetical protein DFP72DRAFT_1151862 [Tulosesus angulatus]
MASQPSWLLNWPLEPVPLSEKPIYGHPELERPDYVTLKSILLRHPVKIDTSVDILDIAGEDATGTHRKNLTHEQLVTHVEADTASPPALRIILLNEATLDPNTPQLEGSFDNTQVALHPSTIYYFIKHMGVCPIFLSNITITPWLLNTGNALFKTAKPESPHEEPQTLASKLSFATQYACPEGAKTNLLRWATAPTEDIRRHVLRPLVLETLIIDEVSWNWSKGVVQTAKKLLEYEHLTAEQYGDGLLNSAVHDLHTLSQHFYIMQEELNGIAEQLDYLIDVHKLLSSSPNSQWSKSRGSMTTTSVIDSLSFLQSRTRNWHRWVHNWRERTNVRINLFFNLATTKIATETQKDSSSMITIAALTLLFLPGTFVAVSLPCIPIKLNTEVLFEQALFSMPFFQTTAPVPTGDHKITMGYGWWLYPAITVPFTVIVFVLWIMWIKQRKSEVQNNGHLQGISSMPTVNTITGMWNSLKTWKDKQANTHLHANELGGFETGGIGGSEAKGADSDQTLASTKKDPFVGLEAIGITPQVSASPSALPQKHTPPPAAPPLPSFPNDQPALENMQTLNMINYNMPTLRYDGSRPEGSDSQAMPSTFEYARPDYNQESFKGYGMWAPTPAPGPVGYPGGTNLFGGAHIMHQQIPPLPVLPSPYYGHVGSQAVPPQAYPIIPPPMPPPMPPPPLISSSASNERDPGPMHVHPPSGQPKAPAGRPLPPVPKKNPLVGGRHASITEEDESAQPWTGNATQAEDSQRPTQGNHRREFAGIEIDDDADDGLSLRSHSLETAGRTPGQ